MATSSESGQGAHDWPRLRRGTRIASVAVCLAMAAFIALYTWLSLLRHRTLGSSAMDLGYTDQVVWNTLHGRFMAFSTYQGARIDLPLNEFRRTDILLAYHVEPLLVPIALLYLLFDSPMTLLVLQVVGVGLGAWPAYLLARDHLASAWAGAVFALAYLLAPAVEGAVVSDFHAVSLAAPLLMWALYCLHKERPVAFVALTVVAMAAKEDIPLLVAMLGLYLLLWKRQRRLGLLTLGLGTAWFLISTQIIVPHYSGLSGSPFLHRLAIFAPTLEESLAAFLAEPDLLLDWLSRPEIVRYLSGLLMSVGFLSLLHPPMLAIAAPILAINVFSTWGWTYSEGEHYTISIIPFIIGSAIYGLDLAAGALARIGIHRQRAIGGLAMLALALAGIHHHQIGVSPLARNFRPPLYTAHHALASSFFGMIPADGTLSAQSNLYPHLAHREKAYLYPAVNEGEYVLLDVTSTTYPLTVDDYYRETLHLLRSGDYGVLAAQDGYLLLQRGLAPSLDGVLPEAFYSFVNASGDPVYPLRARFGDALELVGYDYTILNLVQSQVLPATVTTYWRVLRKPKVDYQFGFFFTRDDGAIEFGYDKDTMAAYWRPPYDWLEGEVVRLETPVLTVGRGSDVLVAVAPPAKSLWESSERLRPEASGIGPERLADDGTLVRLFTFPD